MTEPLRVELGRVTRIVLARPERQNALTAEMGRLLSEGVDRINASPEVRVVVLVGEGRAFSAGGDFALIEENTRRSPEENRRGMLGFYSDYLSLFRLRVPSLAVIHGAAVGAGLAVALACDLRLAAEEAKLGANFVRVGLHPGMGTSVLLPRLVGPARAAELLLTGRLVGGAEAARIGLVHAVCPRAELAALAESWVADLLRAAPLAAAQLKATLVGSVRAELEAGLRHEAEAQALDFATRDVQEAIRAFREGRAPEFDGT